MEIRVLKEKISRSELRKIAADGYGDLVKAVVDARRGVMAISGEFHSDMETFLIEKEGSKREDVWGVNLYPEKRREDFIEFDSLINLKPTYGNRSRNVEDATLRAKIRDIIRNLVLE